MFVVRVSTKAAKMGLETSLTNLGRRPRSFEIRCADDDVYLSLPPQRLTSREMVEVGRFILRAISEKHSCRASPSAMVSRSSTPRRTPGIRTPSLTTAGYYNQRYCNDRLSAPSLCCGHRPYQVSQIASRPGYGTIPAAPERKGRAPGQDLYKG